MGHLLYFTLPSRSSGHVPNEIHYFSQARAAEKDFSFPLSVRTKRPKHLNET